MLSENMIQGLSASDSVSSSQGLACRACGASVVISLTQQPSNCLVLRMILDIISLQCLLHLLSPGPQLLHLSDHCRVVCSRILTVSPLSLSADVSVSSTRVHLPLLLPMSLCDQEMIVVSSWSSGSYSPHWTLSRSLSSPTPASSLTSSTLT